MGGTTPPALRLRASIRPAPRLGFLFSAPMSLSLFTVGNVRELIVKRLP
jgi:hypothetical protein